MVSVLIMSLHFYPMQTYQPTILEYSIPAPTAATPSQKPSHGDISGTKRGIIDPLVSKRLEKCKDEKILKKSKREKKLIKKQKIPIFKKYPIFKKSHIDEVKRPKGPPARSRGPEGPKASSILIFLATQPQCHSHHFWPPLVTAKSSNKVSGYPYPLSYMHNC